jgi:hypothetical protein
MERITPAKKRLIRMEIQTALTYYGDFRAGREVPWKSRPYLQLLDAGDNIGGYLNGVISHRAEYKALKAFTSGNTANDLIANRNGNSVGEISNWIENCPFCDNYGDTGSKGTPYPLTSKPCVHRELAWQEEQEVYDK